MVDLSKLTSNALDFDSRKEGGRFFSIGKNLLMLSLRRDCYVFEIHPLATAFVKVMLNEGLS